MFGTGCPLAYSASETWNSLCFRQITTSISYVIFLPSYSILLILSEIDNGLFFFSHLISIIQQNSWVLIWNDLPRKVHFKGSNSTFWKQLKVYNFPPKFWYFYGHNPAFFIDYEHIVNLLVLLHFIVYQA